MVVITLGIIATLLGAVLATGAQRYPSRSAPMERWGGAFFISGLVLTAWTFPMI